MNQIIASDSLAFHVEVDSTIYSELVCQKACYVLMRHMSAKVTSTEKSYIISGNLEASSNLTLVEIESMLIDELLDYSLREKIAEQTENTRNLILSNAFSNTKLVG